MTTTGPIGPSELRRKRSGGRSDSEATTGGTGPSVPTGKRPGGRSGSEATTGGSGPSELTAAAGSRGPSWWSTVKYDWGDWARGRLKPKGKMQSARER